VFKQTTRRGLGRLDLGIRVLIEGADAKKVTEALEGYPSGEDRGFAVEGGGVLPGDPHFAVGFFFDRDGWLGLMTSLLSACSI